MFALGVDDVVALERRDRQEVDVRDVEPRGERLVVGADPLEHVLRPVDQVHLVDRHHHVADAEQRDDEAWRRVCGSTPLRASIRITARSQVDAPVAMLRVYCSWPGLSAMMNLRFSVEK